MAKPTRRERLRDVAGLLGAAAITVGAGLKFGLAIALIVGGAFALGLAVYDGWAAE